ncbi:MAG: DUF3857 and transglutaminase domain-containing protein [Pontiellaceae bacterium]|nr:DUF3857 and transglutaminase domain-containing protein [Pontiellaceae bacterium]
MRLLFKPEFVFVAVMFLFLAAGGHAETASRNPPPIYHDLLEQELTPIGSLIDQVDYFSPEESTHGCILQENVVHVDTDGRIYEVFHLAFKALGNGELDDLGTDLFSYRADTEKIHLILAETILPEGSVKPVPPEGIIVQAHQEDQNSMVFSGRRQLRLIYPQVQKDSITHCIVLIERESERIPGQFFEIATWERSWQTHLKRLVVNLPKEYADRLNMVTLGNGIPPIDRREDGSGRIRYEWKKEKVPMWKWEYLGGPLVQTGPALFLSTMGSWDEFTGWYAEKIRESSTVDDAVRAVAREWAGDATDEEGIFRNIAFKVANEIRYVSLEFGVAGLQPQPVSSVLENRFGDCKDKANFLRVLLAEHGIKSHVALLQTEHAGRVEKRSVTCEAFNHAILLIERSNGEILFCDPTIRHGSAGLLHPGIAGRPVLVIEEDTSRARWEETPVATAGTLDYSLDLKLSTGGELCGWFYLSAKGYYSSALSSRFEATDRESLKYEVERYLGNFYDTSSVIDFEIGRADARHPEFSLKAYFVLPSTGRSAQSLSWPDIKWLLPRLGEKKEVRREAHLWNDDVVVTLNIDVPETVSLTSIPDKLEVECPGFEAEGTWSRREHGVKAVFTSRLSQSLFTANAFLKLYNAVDATSHWMDKLAILGDGGAGMEETVAAADDGAVVLDGAFIMMSSGAGQLELVNHLYPLETKPKQRRMALEKTKTWFPKDVETQFECDVSLAWLAYSEDRHAECIEAIQQARRAYGDEVAVSSLGWADYLEALALENMGQIDESLNKFLSIEHNSGLDGFRRGYASYQYARILSESRPEEAVEFYLKALGYDTHEEEWFLEQCGGFLLDEMSDEDLLGFLNNMQVMDPDKAGLLATLFSEMGVKNIPALYGMVYGSKIFRVLDRLEFASRIVDAEIMEQLRQADREYAAYQQARERLRAHMDGTAYSFWIETPDKERGFHDYLDDIELAIDESKIDVAARLSLWRILELDPEVEFLSWIWDAARTVDYLYGQGDRGLEPLVELLLGMADVLPSDDEGTFELLFTAAKSATREGDPERALDIYRSLHEREVGKQWHISLYSRWSELLMTCGKAPEAVEVCALGRSGLEDDAEFLPICILGVYALLESGQFDEAVLWIDELAAECGRLEIDDASSAHLKEWSELNQAGKLREFWQFQGAWWPEWVKAREAIGVPSNENDLLPIFSELQSVGQQLGLAMARKDLESAGTLLGGMMTAAKWHPEMTREAQSMIPYLVNVYPEKIDTLHACTIAMNSEAFQVDPVGRYSCRIQTLDALLKTDQYDALMALAESCYQSDTSVEHRGFYVRYGAWAAIYLDMTGTEWLGRMEAHMLDPETRDDPYAVNIMSLLLHQENQMVDAQQLLKQFLADYEGDDDTMRTSLEERLALFNQLVEGNQQLTLALQEWSDAFLPAWVQYFPEQETRSMEVAEVARRIEEIDGSQAATPYRDVVFLLNAAMDERLDSATRESAFWTFLIESMGPLGEFRRNVDMVAAVIRDERFSSRLHELCTRFVLNIVLSSHYAGYLGQEVLPHLEGEAFVKEINDILPQLIDLAELDGNSAEAISAWMDSFREAGKPLDSQTLYLLGSCFSDLCRLGAVDLAEQQIGNARKFRFGAASNGSGFALQLEWQQQVDLLKEWMPLHRILHSFFMDQLKPDYEKPTYAEAQFSESRLLKAERERYQAILQHGLYNHMSLSFWSDLARIELLNGNICTTKSNLEPLMAELLQACKTDSQFVAVLKTISDLIDFDDAECRAIFEGKVADLRGRSDLRNTNLFLLWKNYQCRIRQGELDRSISDLTTEHNLPQMQQYALKTTALLAANDGNAMGNYLARVTPDLLLDPRLIWLSLRACKLSGKDSMLNLIKEQALKEQRELMASALAANDVADADAVARLAEFLDANDPLLAGWLDAMASSAREDSVANVRMVLGNIRKDWAATEQSAEFLVKVAPTMYDNYFYLGKALIKQDRFLEGIEAMSPFMQYCKDSPYYAEAQELLDYAKAQQ